MANEIKWRTKAAESADYMTITAFLAGTLWNTDTDGPALEALDVAHWYSATPTDPSYAISLAESPVGSHRYLGSWPALLTAVGFYIVDIYEKAGVDPDIDDDPIATLIGYWDGTYFKPVGVDVSQWKGATAPAMTGDAYAVANGRLPAALTANGNIKASLVEILTTALTETGGQIAAGFKKLFNVATPVATVESVNQAGDSFTRIGAPVGASISADIAGVAAAVDGVGEAVGDVQEDVDALDTHLDEQDTSLAGIISRQEADLYVDTTGASWVLQVRTKGTSTVLFKKTLLQVDGTAVTTVDHLIGRQTHAA